jgi:hypothetical protein
LGAELRVCFEAAGCEDYGACSDALFPVTVDYFDAGNSSVRVRG